MNLFPEKKLHNLIFNSQEIILYIFMLFMYIVGCKAKWKSYQGAVCRKQLDGFYVWLWRTFALFKCLFFSFPKVLFQGIESKVNSIKLR